MTIDDVLQLLEQVPRPPDDRGYSGASEEQLRSLSEFLGMPLPADLREWLRVCNGVVAGPGGVYGTVDITTVLGIHPEWRDAGWIPVAGDGTGNHYVVDTRRRHLDTDAVFFIDVMEDPTALSYIAASTLRLFLTALLRKELGDRAWPFQQSYVASSDPALLAVHPPALLPWASG